MLYSITDLDDNYVHSMTSEQVFYSKKSFPSQ